MDTPHTEPAASSQEQPDAPLAPRWALLAALLRDDVLSPRSRPSREVERAAAALREYVRRTPTRPA